MNVNTTGKDFIKKWECNNIAELTVKDDGFGNLTVGYGHKVVTADKLKAGDKITQAKADSFFTSDLSTVETAINKHPKVGSMTQVMYNATASLLYNVGTSPVTTTTNDLYKALNSDATYKSPISTAAKNAVVTAFTYTKVNGKRVEGLVNRRNAELNVFLGTTDKIYITMN
ncbi:lysozyme [Kineothrix sedimenti]|uniref:Lysozyme n=1 Tax=Kineothrix sedimenti TaxID=3123317 RepID=A0ABZ3EWW2_9FIRM